MWLVVRENQKFKSQQSKGHPETKIDSPMYLPVLGHQDFTRQNWNAVTLTLVLDGKFSSNIFLVKLVTMLTSFHRSLTCLPFSFLAS